jgi:hypothetical protein
MHVEKEDLEKKQDEIADELCALLERAGRGGESSRQFEVPEYARRRIDVALSSGKLIGHFKSLVIVDWKRKDHHEGDAVEERMSEQDILTGVAVLLKKEGLQVFTDEATHRIYVVGLEEYNGIPVKGLEGGHLYELYSPHHTDESWDITADGEGISNDTAEMREGALTLVTSRGTEISLKPFNLSEAEYVRDVRGKSVGGN